MDFIDNSLPTHLFVKEKSYRELLLSHANLESLISPNSPSTSPSSNNVNDNFVNEWASILSSKAKRDRYTSFLFSQIERIDKKDRDENTLNEILQTSKEFLANLQDREKEKKEETKTNDEIKSNNKEERNSNASKTNNNFLNQQIKKNQDEISNAELLLLSKLAVLELENVMNLVLWYLDTLSTLIWLVLFIFFI